MMGVDRYFSWEKRNGWCLQLTLHNWHLFIRHQNTIQTLACKLPVTHANVQKIKREKYVVMQYYLRIILSAVVCFHVQC